MKRAVSFVPSSLPTCSALPAIVVTTPSAVTFRMVALNVSATNTLPALSTYGLGNAPQTLFWGPVFKNVDLAISKSFPVANEGYSLVLRVDMLNAFNMLNLSDPNTTLQYNYNTGAQNNANFGQITSQTGLPATGQQRVIVGSLRFKF